MGGHQPTGDIVRLREQVEYWRRTRPAKGPMPAELWAEAEAVARKRGLYVTARGAGVDYGTLAKRLNAAPREAAEAVAFVEWSGAELLGGAPRQAVIEMSDASGRRVAVRLHGGEALDVAGIVAAFMGSRS